jgi:superfamily II DNA helicase RecQ
MEKFGLKGLVINSDTIHEAQLRQEDLWEQATTGPNLLFLASEQLASPGFSALAKEDSEFAARVCAIAVDEAHLLLHFSKIMTITKNKKELVYECAVRMLRC